MNILPRPPSCARLLPAKRATMRGVAAVEFALLLIPMIFLAFGVVDFGRALYEYDTLVKAVRDATRLLSEHSPSDAGYPSAAAKCLAVYGTMDCAGSPTPLAPGLTTDMVVICDRISSPNSAPAPDCAGAAYENVNTGSGTINLVQVRITGFTFTPFVPLVPSLTGLTFGDIRATMRQVL